MNEQIKDYTYFACLVHDLKTPLIAQKRIIELFLNNTFGNISSVQRDILTEFKKSDEYLQDLVSDILSLYLYENKKIILNKEIFDLSELVKELINKSFVILNGKQIYYQISPVSIYADKMQMKRVVINLISNSIRYSCPNSTIFIKSGTINNKIVFEVKNKSCYPLPQNMNIFFEKFKTNNPYSSGLGLYIVAQIIKSLEGEVFAKKGRNNSCTFGFKIPVRISS